MLQYFVGYWILQHIHEMDVKNQAVRYVNSIPGRKLNIGATGAGQLTNPVHLNDMETRCDIIADYAKNIYYCELGEHLPYDDGQFSVVLASHVLEHVEPNKIRCALKEMNRVGDQVVLVLPNSLSVGFYIGNGHKSKIYNIKIPNGLHIKSMDGTYDQKIYLDPASFKIYQ